MTELLYTTTQNQMTLKTHKFSPSTTILPGIAIVLRSFNTSVVTNVVRRQFSFISITHSHLTQKILFMITKLFLRGEEERAFDLWRTIGTWPSFQAQQQVAQSFRSTDQLVW